MANSKTAKSPPYNAVKRPNRTKSKAIGKIGGVMLLLILLFLFVAAHGRNNEIMYVTLLFVFLAIAFFSYGYWSAVNRGDGIWQYIGPNNLQHQQVSNPNYHFSTVPNFKGHPNSRMHLVAPPKMGGAHLEIYTLSDESLTKNDSRSTQHSPNCVSKTPNAQQGQHSQHHPAHHHSHHLHHHHHHHKHHHRNNSVHRLYHQHHHEQIVLNQILSPEQNCDDRCIEALTLDVGKMPTTAPVKCPRNEGFLLALPIRSGRSCVDLIRRSDEDDDKEPVKCEVNLSRSASYHKKCIREREVFAEVQLPPLKP